MMMLGIDPGKDGALVVLDGDVVTYQARTADLLVRPEKGKSLYNPSRMVEVLLEVRALGCRRAVLERAWPRPGEASNAAHTAGEGRGLWRGMLAALGFEVVEPAPASWVAKVLRDLPGEGKARAILLAEGAPGLELRRGRQRKAHDGTADAYGLARYGLMVSR